MPIKSVMFFLYLTKDIVNQMGDFATDRKGELGVAILRLYSSQGTFWRTNLQVISRENFPKAWKNSCEENDIEEPFTTLANIE